MGTKESLNQEPPNDNNPQQPIPGILGAVPPNPQAAPAWWALPEKVKNSISPDAVTTLAEGFEEMHENFLLYRPEKKEWSRFDGGVWEPGNPAAYAKAKEICKLALGYMRSKGEVPSRDSRRLLSHELPVSILNSAKESMIAPPGDFDKNLEIAGLPGGYAADLSRAAIRPAQPGEMITKKRRVLPDYAKPVPHKLIDFLVYTISQKYPEHVNEIMEYLHLYLGYCATGYCIEQKFIFLQGLPASGKSTLLNFLLWLWGDYGCAVSPDTFSHTGRGQHRERFARLEGARLIAIDETDGSKWNTSDLNMFVTGGTITANHMHQGSFDFEAQSKIIVTGNQKPSASELSGIFRRMLLFECPFSIPPDKQNPDLLDELKEEAASAEAWIHHGALRWFRLARKNYPVPMPIVRGVAEYQSAQNPLEPFLDEYYRPVENGWQKLKDVHKLYTEHSKENAESRPLRIQHMRPHLEAYGVKLRKYKGAMFIVDGEVSRVNATINDQERWSGEDG